MAVTFDWSCYWFPWQSFQVSCFSFRLCRSNANGLLFLSKTLLYHDLEPVLKKNIPCLDDGITV